MSGEAKYTGKETAAEARAKVLKDHDDCLPTELTRVEALIPGWNVRAAPPPPLPGLTQETFPPEFVPIPLRPDNLKFIPAVEMWTKKPIGIDNFQSTTHSQLSYYVRRRLRNMPLHSGHIMPSVFGAAIFCCTRKYGHYWFDSIKRPFITVDFEPAIKTAMKDSQRACRSGVDSERTAGRTSEWDGQLLVDLKDPTTSIWCVVVCNHCAQAKTTDTVKIELPKDMFEVYSSPEGFYWKMLDIRALQFVAVIPKAKTRTGEYGVDTQMAEDGDVAKGKRRTLKEPQPAPTAPAAPIGSAVSAASTSVDAVPPPPALSAPPTSVHGNPLKRARLALDNEIDAVMTAHANQQREYEQCKRGYEQYKHENEQYKRENDAIKKDRDHYKQLYHDMLNRDSLDARTHKLTAEDTRRRQSVLKTLPTLDTPNASNLWQPGKGQARVRLRLEKKDKHGVLSTRDYLGPIVDIDSDDVKIMEQLVSHNHVHNSKEQQSSQGVVESNPSWRPQADALDSIPLVELAKTGPGLGFPIASPTYSQYLRHVRFDVRSPAMRGLWAEHGQAICWDFLLSHPDRFILYTDKATDAANARAVEMLPMLEREVTGLVIPTHPINDPNRIALHVGLLCAHTISDNDICFAFQLDGQWLRDEDADAKTNISMPNPKRPYILIRTGDSTTCVHAGSAPEVDGATFIPTDIEGVILEMYKCIGEQGEGLLEKVERSHYLRWAQLDRKSGGL